MKKIIIFSAIIIVTTIKGYSQLATMDAGAIAASLENIATLRQLIKVQENNLELQGLIGQKVSEMENNQRNLLDIRFLQHLESLRKIHQLMEAMYCQQQEMYILLSVSGSNCLIDLNVQMSLLNLTVSQDIIRTQFVVGALTFMRETPADQRMSFLENIATAIEKSIAQIQRLNSGLKAHITSEVVMNYLRKEEQRTAQVIARNRYH